MDNTTFRQIGDAIEKNSSIGIVTAKNPTVDEMGAALALYLTLVTLGKSVTIATPENPLVEVSSLVGIDRVMTSLSGKSGDLTVSFPYQEGEIEKVSYTLENGLLNIVVKAGEKGLSFEENEVSFTRSQGAPNLLFVIGVPRLSDLGKLFNVTDLKNTMIINIDNKADNQGFGDVIMVYPMLSSISEQVANLIVSLNLKIDIDIAQNLMQGISFATNNFQDVKTSALAFEMASILMKNGAIRISNNNSRLTQAVNTEQFFPKPVSRNQAAPVNQPVQKPIAKQQEAEKELANDNPPEDWLAPKIYKGSTNF
ncbi:MAG: hypothetical protein M1405_01270 [Patescibacteria group bacterium]|nr:hypothetical protein [Patescibacteria group bacterium]